MSQINLNQIKIVDETGLAADGSVIISRRVADSLWSSNYTGSILLPRGDTVTHRPTPPEPGHIRYNTDGNFFEGWDGSTWFRFANSRLPDGAGNTCAQPPLSFVNSIDTGIASENPGELNLAASGICAATFTDSGTTIENGLTVNSSSPAVLTFSVDGTARSAIRDDSATARLEFSGSIGDTSGTGSDVSFFIDRATKDVCFLEPVKFASSLKFDDGGSGGNYEIGSTTGIDVIVDCENVDTTSLFRVNKHLNDPTGFSVDQDGRVKAGSGDIADPGYGFDESAGTGWYYRPNPIDSMVATLVGTDSLQLTATYNASLLDLRIEDGSPAVPSLAFSSDTDTGIFHVGGDELGVSAGGMTKLRVNSQCVNADVPIGIVDGTAALPAIKFNNSGDTGIFLAGSGVIGFTATGTQVVHVDADSMDLIGSAQLRTTQGSAPAPSITFVADPDTGLHNPAADTIAVSTNGGDRVVVNDAETQVLNKLVIEGPVCYGTGGSGAEELPVNVVELQASQTDSPLASPLTYPASQWQAVFVDYLVKRDTGIAVGTLMISTDGTETSLADQSSNINNTGITFDVTLVAGQVSVTYTSTAGNSAQMKYSVKRMGL